MMKKKRYIQPEAEFEEIEGLDNLLDHSKPEYETEGDGSTIDNDPTKLPWGGNSEGEGDDGAN